MGPNNPLISVSQAHTAMEYYRLAHSENDFNELSTTMLAYLYLIKVQNKPAGYESMDTDEKKKWNQSRMKTLQRYRKKKLIEALMNVVRIWPSRYEHIN